MAGPDRAWTYDDDLHERRRKLALPPPAPIDFEAWRLRKLQEKAKETRDP